MANSRKKILTAAMLFLLLGVPVLWVVINKTGKHYSKTLPIYFERELDSQGDTVYHTVSDFELVNQNGDSVSLANFDGKIILANFFFTSCETVCPAMNAFISQHIYREFIKDPEIAFVSISVDPGKDSVTALKQYEKDMAASAPGWQFLSGNRARIYNLAQYSFRVPGAESEHQGLFHSDQVVLVDKERRVRGVFNTGGLDNKKLIIDSIRGLYLEYRAGINI
jgi:protein SCO1/2